MYDTYCYVVQPHSTSQLTPPLSLLSLSSILRRRPPPRGEKGGDGGKPQRGGESIVFFSRRGISGEWIRLLRTTIHFMGEECRCSRGVIFNALNGEEADPDLTSRGEWRGRRIYLLLRPVCSQEDAQPDRPHRRPSQASRPPQSRRTVPEERRVEVQERIEVAATGAEGVHRARHQRRTLAFDSTIPSSPRNFDRY